ncbi:MAG TPA: PSD1 and planctomycete cytochrome C domain-containing protein [Gemmataceae bacterium]|nr:PSD1 and planctomycete cytochrome C domain-containing protein [Gemmataceae bacterium]
MRSILQPGPKANCTACLLAVAVLLAGAWRAAGDSFFVTKIAPVLQERCLRCHNAQKSRGGLDLSTRAGVLKGGDDGPAVVPGAAQKSLLVRQISGPEPKMPKQGARLTSEEIANIKQWIDRGALWAEGITLHEARAKWRVGPDWWSLRKLARPPVPAVESDPWVRTPVDAFILATLQSKGLKPSLPADRRTLIRRVTFDLHGLPPTPDEIDAFVNDQRPDAYERLVDRLLASPRYGERWGRHWLDVVHYGDTHGYDKDKRRDHAWPYRDYVIRSFNNDKPYARFIKEQIAGDVCHPGDPDGIVATGFIATGPWDFVGHVELREGTVDKEKTRLLDRDDMVSNTISTFLSLTAHCARCHDHKFDPIPKREYYGLQAVFAGVDRGDRQYGKGAAVYALVSHAPRPIYDLHRGDVEQRGDLAKAGALSCVAGLDAHLGNPDPQNEAAARRALAEWIADSANVLTWRSAANRIWHYHFGRGIVDTPNDFGWNGARPSHADLLDWLAVELRDRGGSFKHLHRLVLLSATYRQASHGDAGFARIDADNRYLWRMNRQRLEAEEIRDAVLSLSGKLDQKMGGPGFDLFRFKDDHSPVYDHSAIEKINDPAVWRRTVYRFTVRSVPNPFLECLDCADPNLNAPVRTTTLTALQALALLNDPFMLKQAECFAERLQRTVAGVPEQIDAAYHIALGRPASAEEVRSLTEYARSYGLANACRLLFNLNEFVFVD